VAHAGIPVDCTNRTVRQCFQILSAWIADYIANVALHRLKTNASPKCEVPTYEVGINAKNYQCRDYARYQRYKHENANSGSESDNDHVISHNHGIGQNIFHRLDCVSASGLYKPDMLHTIYLGLFKHMMVWIEGFLKKHRQLQAFDNVWKALPPYPGFPVTNTPTARLRSGKG